MHVHTVHVVLHDPDTVDECASLMLSMRGRIDSMLSLQVVVNEHRGSYSADLSLTTVWPDLSAYHEYETHPEHLRVRTRVLELMKSATTLDYTVSSLPTVSDAGQAP